MEVMLTSAQADCQALQGQLIAAKAKGAKAPGLSPPRARCTRCAAITCKLCRDADQHRRQLAFWEDNLRRVRMAAAAENGDRGVKLDFIKPCPQLYRPVSPNVTQVLLAAVGLGLLAGAGNGVFQWPAAATSPSTTVSSLAGSARWAMKTPAPADVEQRRVLHGSNA